VFGLNSDLNLTGTQFSWVVTLFYFGQLTSEFPASYLMSRFPVTKVVGVTMLVNRTSTDCKKQWVADITVTVSSGVSVRCAWEQLKALVASPPLDTVSVFVKAQRRLLGSSLRATGTRERNIPTVSRE